MEAKKGGCDMKKQNICNIIATRSSDLICERFIYETTDVQREKVVSDAHTLGLIVKGGGKLLIGEKSLPLNEKCLFLVRRSVPFSIERADDMEYSYISFSGRRADELLERFGIRSDYTTLSLTEDIAPFWLDCLHHVKKETMDLLSESVLLYSLAHLPAAPIKSNSLTQKMIDLTADRFTDASFTITSIAKELRYDAKYLSFRFKKDQGISYTQYLRSLRIKHAVFLFEQGMTCVKNVSLLVGIHDPLYFSRIFKAEIGVSPSDYVKKVAQDDR